MDILKQAARIKTWNRRCEEHPDHQTGMVSHSMIQARMQEEIDDLRAALAQPDESFCDTHCTWHDHHPDCFMARIEPMAWLRKRDNTLAVNDGGVFGDEWTPLYARPPQRKPLTEEDIELAYREIWRDLSDGFSHTSAEWIEAGIRYAEKVHGIE